MKAQTNENENSNSEQVTALDIKYKYKKNGFDLPFSGKQIFTWIVYIIQIVLFVECPLMISWKVNKPLFYFSLIFFILTSIAILIISIILTVLDPVDDLVIKEKEKIEECKRKEMKYVLEIHKNVPFCIICCCNVENSSKHCKKCNKCIINFDHHCVWINNCIGSKNYKLFYTLLVIAITYSLYCASISIYIFIYRKIKDDNCKIKEILSLCLGIIDLIISGNLIYLFVIHSYLRYIGKTTYEYIMESEESSNKCCLGILSLHNKTTQKSAMDQSKDEHINKSKDILVNDKKLNLEKEDQKKIDNKQDVSIIHSNSNINRRNNNVNLTSIETNKKKKKRNFMNSDTLVFKLDELQTIQNKKNLYEICDDKILIDDENAKENIFSNLINEIYKNANDNS